jgi:hypothetical protein
MCAFAPAKWRSGFDSIQVGFGSCQRKELRAPPGNDKAKLMQLQYLEPAKLPFTSIPALKRSGPQGFA